MRTLVWCSGVEWSRAGNLTAKGPKNKRHKYQLFIFLSACCVPSSRWPCPLDSGSRPKNTGQAERMNRCHWCSCPPHVGFVIGGEDEDMYIRIGKGSECGVR